MILSQMEFVEEPGVSFATVNRWGNKRFNPSMKIKRKLKGLCDNNNINIGGFNDDWFKFDKALIKRGYSKKW